MNLHALHDSRDVKQTRQEIRHSAVPSRGGYMSVHLREDERSHAVIDFILQQLREQINHFHHLLGILSHGLITMSESMSVLRETFGHSLEEELDHLNVFFDLIFVNICLSFAWLLQQAGVWGNIIMSKNRAEHGSDVHMGFPNQGEIFFFTRQNFEPEFLAKFDKAQHTGGEWGRLVTDVHSDGEEVAATLQRAFVVNMLPNEAEIALFAQLAE